MNKTVMKAALLAAFGVVAIAPLAASAANTSIGTVTINGAIVTSTCNVNSPTVTLPTVDTGTLASTGSTAGWTSFSVTLSGCSTVSGATKVFPYFSGSNVNTSNGYLNNNYTGTGSASNVEIALSNGQSTAVGTVLALQNASGSQNVTAQALPTTGTSTINFNFYAGYVAATAAATAGGVATTVQYDLNYQ